MDRSAWAVPAASALIACGVSIGTLQALADDSQDLAERGRSVEIEQAGDESVKVMVKQNTDRLERLEAVVMENAKQLSAIREDMAAICASTGSNCPR